MKACPSGRSTPSVPAVVRAVAIRQVGKGRGT